MKKAFGPYKRLARGFLSCSSLWIGDGQLLYIRGRGILLPFSEEYIRFDLSRIRSVSVARTYTWIFTSIGTAAVSALFAWLSLLASQSAAESSGDDSLFTTYLAGGLDLVAAFTLALVLVNVSRGPSCVFMIQTSARSERIRSVRRMRKARQVLAEIGPDIYVRQVNMIPSPPPMPAALAPQPAAAFVPSPAPVDPPPVP